MGKIIRHLGNLLLPIWLFKASAAVWYVNGTNTSPVKDGRSWDTGLTSVQAAIDRATAGDQVWVSAGRYGERITVKAGVEVYGGFFGSEGLLQERNWTKNETLLEAGNFPIVRFAAGSTNTSRFDGFTVQSGTSGGIDCVSASPVIANNVIQKNQLFGIHCGNSFARITNNIVRQNGTLSVRANGIYCESGKPVILDNFIVGNVGSIGGGIYCESSAAEISGNLILRNAATVEGGGIACVSSGARIRNNRIVGNLIAPAGGMTAVGGAGVSCRANPAPVIENNLFLTNSAPLSSSASGGGLACRNGSSPSVVNNTFLRNRASTGGQISIQQATGQPVMINNIITFGSSGISATSAPRLTNNCIFGNGTNQFSGFGSPIGSEGNIEKDPILLENSDFADVRLSGTSPCIDRGETSVVALDTFDLKGDERIQNGVVDIGADEFSRRFFQPQIIFVSADGDDRNSGKSWASPVQSINEAIRSMQKGGAEIWVKAGVHLEQVSLRLFSFLYGGFHGNEHSRTDRSNLEPTIVDAQETGTVFTAEYLFEFVGIDQFTIRNGATTGQGGGVAAMTSSPRITNNRIESNRAAAGGGIGAFASSPFVNELRIHNNLILNNRATQGGLAGNVLGSGGGILLLSSSGRIVNNVLMSNSVSSGTAQFSGLGSAIFLSDLASTVVGNSVVFNDATDSTTGTKLERGAIYLLSTSSLVANNLIANNSGGIQVSKGGPSLSNNCLFANGSDYIGVVDPTGTNGNIKVDPRILTANGFVHLFPSSPCIDAGENTVVSVGEFDLDGQPRIVNGKVDMGSDEVLFRLDIERQAIALEVFSTEVFAQSYSLQASTNLIDWMTVDTAAGRRFPVQSMNDAARFFRMIAAP